MLNRNWREQTWADLKQPWDILVIGGGITGAGIFNMAAQKGFKTLLIEANDFAFGTSSRSSKLVHGGIRYLRNAQFDVVKESVKERERLIRESAGLVDPLAFIFPSYGNNIRDSRMMKLGVIFYDLLAPKWRHRTLDKIQVKAALPAIEGDDLLGGVEYFDSRVDDSQLVLRVIMDGIRYGGSAINYAKVIELCKANNGRVEGVIVQDKTHSLQPSEKEVHARVVINAAGPWSDEIRVKIKREPQLRRLRGSHLIFSHEKLPIHAAVTMLHPRDNRALFAIPWEGCTMIGTTDLDHDLHEDETRITQLELDYLKEAAHNAFPEFPISEEDIHSTFSGLRPVINTNAATPSKESRAHKVWEEDGLVTVAGGKLTIFRVMAADVLNFCRPWLPNKPRFNHCSPCFIPPKRLVQENLDNPEWIRMAGRLGTDVDAFFETAEVEHLQPIKPMPALWAELVWAARNEAVFHLDDLLLRRVRMGLLLPSGGLNQLDRVRRLVQEPLAWSDQRWEQEASRYKKLWRKNYYLPD